MPETNSESTKIRDAAAASQPLRHTGFGDCACEKCWPPEPEYPLADHGKPLGMLGSLWLVLKGLRLYGYR